MPGCGQQPAHVPASADAACARAHSMPCPAGWGPRRRQSRADDCPRRRSCRPVSPLAAPRMTAAAGAFERGAGNSCKVPRREPGREPVVQRLEPLCVVSPFPDRRGIDRPPNLNRTGGRRRRLAFVEAENSIFPREAYKFDDTAALCRLIAYYVFIPHFQQCMRREARFPVLREPAISEIILSQFQLIVCKQKPAAEMGLVHGPAGIERMAPDHDNLRPRQRRMNDPAVKLILQRLVDETPVPGDAKCADRIRIPSDQISTIEAVAGQVRGTAERGCERACFTCGRHAAVAGNDPFNDGRSGARQADDKYRVGIVRACRTRAEPASGLRANDTVDTIDLGFAVVTNRLPLQFAARSNLSERLACSPRSSYSLAKAKRSMTSDSDPNSPSRSKVSISSV